MNLYIECLEYDIEWSFKTNLFYSHGKKDMFKRVKQLQNLISKSHGMKKGCFIFNETRLRNAADRISRKRFLVIVDFEKKMVSLTDKVCIHCHGLYVDYKTNRQKYICKHCSTKQNTDGRRWKTPHWIDCKGKINNEVPLELQNLRLGEQLLIQKASPYIPIVHIRHGILGIHGHCISFPQDISSICTNLPRIDCKIVRFIRHSGKRSELFSDENSSSFDEFLV